MDFYLPHIAEGHTRFGVSWRAVEKMKHVRGVQVAGAEPQQRRRQHQYIQQLL